MAESTTAKQAGQPYRDSPEQVAQDHPPLTEERGRAIVNDLLMQGEDWVLNHAIELLLGVYGPSNDPNRVAQMDAAFNTALYAYLGRRIGCPLLL